MLIINLKIKKNISLISLICLVILFLPSFSDASLNLSVTPQKLDLTVYPGHTESFQLRLKNNSQTYLPITANITPFGAYDGSGEMTFEETIPNGPHTWISFSESDFILSPNEEKRLAIKISIPVNTNPGGYYLFVNFQPRIPTFNIEEPGPKVVPIIGVPVLISTAKLLIDEIDQEAVLEITDFSINDNYRNHFLERGLSLLPIAFATDQPVSFYVTKKIPDKLSLTIKNNDLYHVFPKGEVLITEKSGEVVASGKINGATILPGKSRHFELDIENFSGNLFANTGYYYAVLDFFADSPIRHEISIKPSPYISFFNFPHYFWIIIFISILFIFLIRKNIIFLIKISFFSVKSNFLDKVN